MPFLFGKTPRLATIHYRRDDRRTQYYSISATVSAGRLKTRRVDDEGDVTLCLLVIASRQTTPRWSTRPVSSTAANESGTSSTTALRPHTSSPRPRLWWYLSAEHKIRGSCGGMNTLYCDSRCISLMPATRAQETVTRNWYKSSCTRNLHVCRSVWYKFFLAQVYCTVEKKEFGPNLHHRSTPLHAIEHSCSIQTQDSFCAGIKLQRAWLGSCFGARNCDELASNFSCKFLVQVSCACVAGITVLTRSFGQISTTYDKEWLNEFDRNGRTRRPLAP